MQSVNAIGKSWLLLVVSRKPRTQSVYNTMNDWYVQTRLVAAQSMPRVMTIQFRDLRGKAATDLEDLSAAQSLLGHSTRSIDRGVRKGPSGRSRSARDEETVVSIRRLLKLTTTQHHSQLTSRGLSR